MPRSHRARPRPPFWQWPITIHTHLNPDLRDIAAGLPFRPGQTGHTGAVCDTCGSYIAPSEQTHHLTNPRLDPGRYCFHCAISLALWFGQLELQDLQALTPYSQAWPDRAAEGRTEDAPTALTPPRPHL